MTPVRARSGHWLLIAASLPASVLVVGVTAVGAQEAPPPAEPPSGVVTWQSAGDSYSSGEGVFGNVGDCAQSESAYGPQAVLGMEARRWSIDATFTACTGHLVADYFVPRSDDKVALWDWGRQQGGPERVDVITMSFGGNDIGFPDVIVDCLAVLPDSWTDYGELVSPATGCDTSEAELQGRVDALLDPPRTGCTGTRVDGRAGFDCDLNLGSRRGSIIDFYYDVVTERLTERGLLVVVGYPRLFAPVDQWAGWVKVACKGITRGDTEKLGRLAEHFNRRLRKAVERANEALGRERVLYVDRYAAFADGKHELCGTNDDWLNGISTTRGEGLTFRYQTSFHPNASGHADTATRVAELVDQTFDRSAPVDGSTSCPDDADPDLLNVLANLQPPWSERATAGAIYEGIPDIYIVAICEGPTIIGFATVAWDRDPPSHRVYGALRDACLDPNMQFVRENYNSSPEELDSVFGKCLEALGDGWLDATMSLQAVQLYLNMLGYGGVYGLDEDGLLGPASRSAIEEFQVDNGFEPTGEPTEATLERLVVLAGDQTFVIDCGDNTLHRPGEMVLACSLSTWLDVTWETWTALEATGHGVLNQRSCDPSCVESDDVIATPVDVRLIEPERWRCGDGRPYLLFTRVELTDEDGHSWSQPVSEFYSC